MEPSGNDLRVAKELIGKWGFFHIDDPETAALALAIASALAAEREEAAKIAETHYVLSH